MRIPSLHRRRGLPLADLPELRRPAVRTTVVRVALGLALATTLGGLLLVARSAGSGRAAVLPSGASTGVVALDMSASISGPVFARVAATLRGIVDANQAIGLVMFSDTAYELLPPNSPPGALLQFLPYFTPVSYNNGAPIFAPSPWDRFSGGTRISTGLAMARRALQQANVSHGAIIVISDLDESVGDQEALVLEALRLRRAHIPLRIVPLFADPANRRYFATLFGDGAFVNPSAFTHVARRNVEPVAASAPWALLTLGALLVLLLTGNELLNGRLSVEGAT